jgi:hypothetical protein
MKEAKRRDGTVGDFANPYNSRRERTYVPTIAMRGTGNRDIAGSRGRVISYVTER